MARRNCRRHVFLKAAIRHEPKKLIDGPVWGPNLFPASLVQVTLDSAVSANQSLKSRWNLFFKRKSQETQGSSATVVKKTKKSLARGGGAAGYRIPKKNQPQQQPQFAVLTPAPSTSGAAQGLVLLQPSQSPAFHAPYEQASSFPGYQFPRGGGGSQRRGKGRGISQARGKGNSQKRGKGRGSSHQ